MLRWIVIGGLLYLFWPRKARAADVLVQDLPGDDDDDDPDAPTIRDVIDPLISDTPRLNAAYQIKAGDILYGDNGVISRALRDAGESDTGADRVAYYKAIGRVRSNWRLYGTLMTTATPAVERVQVRSASGEVALGTITAALCSRHDRWLTAAAQGELPVRLIGWTRSAAQGKCASIRNRSGWQQLVHGDKRAYGLLWLPPIEAVDLGMDVTDRPDMDWPAALYTAAGTTWEDAFA